MVVGGWQVPGGLEGVLPLEGEGGEEGGCSWPTASCRPTYWTSCLLGEGPLLGELGEEKHTVKHQSIISRTVLDRK